MKRKSEIQLISILIKSLYFSKYEVDMRNEGREKLERLK